MAEPTVSAIAGPTLTDHQQRQAWSRFTTQQIREMPMPAGPAHETARAWAGRKRILALRQADESAA